MPPISQRQRRPVSPVMRRAAAALAIFAAAGSWSGPAAAGMALPILTACRPATAPTLPMRWRAVALMMPFVRQQIDVGEFIYDGSLPAMRATLYGPKSGAVDLLITEKQTYKLTGPQELPNGCIALGRRFRPPGKQWLSGKAVCDGEAPVGEKTVQW
jgi:hypothetical protein